MLIIVAQVVEAGRFTPDGVAEKLRTPRIFVIGMGTINPLGHNVPSTWENAKAGKNGISAVDFEYSKVKVAGVVEGFDPDTSIPTLEPREVKRRSRPTLLARKAAEEALRDANMLGENGKLREEINANRVGVFIGTGIGGAMLIAEASERLKAGTRTTPSDLLKILLERVAVTISKDFGAKGPLMTPSAACATGNVAISLGVDKIRAGKADAMIVGGTEATNNFISFELFRNSTALTKSEDPQTASRPYDKARDGFIFGEGAGILVIATEEFADKIGAHKYAELVGCGDTADAFHDTAPSGEGAVRAMQEALGYLTEEERAEAVTLVDGHGTSTKDGDPSEANGIRTVFSREELADRVIVYLPKGKFSHMIGAAGSVEAVVGIKAMEEGIVPGNANLVDRMDEAEGFDMPTQTVRRDVNVMMNNSFGFGGINSVVVFKKAK